MIRTSSRRLLLCYCNMNTEASCSWFLMGCIFGPPQRGQLYYVQHTRVP